MCSYKEQKLSRQKKTDTKEDATKWGLLDMGKMLFFLNWDDKDSRLYENTTVCLFYKDTNIYQSFKYFYLLEKTKKTTQVYSLGVNLIQIPFSISTFHPLNQLLIKIKIKIKNKTISMINYQTVYKQYRLKTIRNMNLMIYLISSTSRTNKLIINIVGY